MEKPAMCRICLVQNVRMYVVVNKNLQELYEKLTDVPFVTEDSRPMLACFFCFAKLQQCYQLLQKCLEAEKLFTQMLNEDYEIKPLKIKRAHSFYGGYVKTQIQHLNIDDCHLEDNDIKREPFEPSQDVVEMKVEHRSDEVTDNLDNNYLEIELPSHNFDSDSEDDVPLVKFKAELEEEEGRKKKNGVKKKYRKPDCTVISLTKTEQQETMVARAKSSNYMHSPFKCSLCYKGFIDARAFENHKVKHDLRSGAYACDICHMRYQSTQLLRTHANNAHARIFKCNKCAHISHTSHQARIHEKWHNGHTYECQLCSLAFRVPTSYLSHLRKRHPTEHVCNICGETFVGKHGLQMHKRKSHNNGEKMVDSNDPADPASKRFCAKCNIQFYNYEAWEQHILSSVRHTLQAKESKTCAICQWQYAGNRGNISWETHMNEHRRALRKARGRRVTAKERMYRCIQGGSDNCGNILCVGNRGNISWETHMNEHRRALRKARGRRVTAKERMYRCNQCGSSFLSPSKLQAHINRTHLGLKNNRKFVCEVCGRKCTSNATLNYHQRTHTGEKPYSCTTCSKHFPDKNQLRIHSRTHSGERPYVCAACGKRFTQKPALTRHYRIHTGAKPYSCQYCSRTFNQSSSVKLHVNAIHLKKSAYKKSKAKNDIPETKMEKNCEELETGT